MFSSPDYFAVTFKTGGSSFIISCYTEKLTIKKKKVFKKKIQAHSSSPPGLLCYHQHLLMWLLHNHELSNCHHPVSTLLNCCNYREKGNCATGCIKAQCALSTWRAHVYFDSFNLITGKEYNQLWLNVKDSCSTTQSSDCSLSVL